MNPTKRSSQQGATLIVALIFLVLMTLLAVTSFNIGKSNLQVVGNMQRQNEALNAAQEAIDAAVSKTLFAQTPAAALPNPCGAANTMCVDTNGDGSSDVTVALTPVPSCIKAQTVKNANLNLANAEDAGCAVGAAQNFGVAGAATGDSLCADSVWEINAVATDNSSGASVTVTEGVAVRVSTDNIATSCP